MQKDQPKQYEELSDEELMSFYQLGEYFAFETLYLRHSGRVYSYLQKKVPAEVANDLLQDIFEKLHRARAKYNAAYPFLPWLFTVARNSLFDHFKLAENKLASQSHAEPALIENLPMAEERETPNMAKLLEGLPVLQRQAIELRYLHDWSFEKIAAEIKTSQENVRQIISRGLKKIRLSRSKGDL